MDQEEASVGGQEVPHDPPTLRGKTEPLRHGSRQKVQAERQGSSRNGIRNIIITLSFLLAVEFEKEVQSETFSQQRHVMGFPENKQDSLMASLLSFRRCSSPLASDALRDTKKMSVRLNRHKTPNKPAQSDQKA